MFKYDLIDLKTLTRHYKINSLQKKTKKRRSIIHYNYRIKDLKQLD